VAPPSSVEMVIFAAVGGRTSLVGAAFGTLLVGMSKSFLSETFPALWLFLLGALFIGIVLILPSGLAGVLNRLAGKLTAKRVVHEAPESVIEDGRGVRQIP